jgi:hypothetical protein
MKTRFVPALSVLPLCISSAAVAQQYSPGFTWDRSTDWAAGPVAGSTTGNPMPDAQGMSVWSYEWVQGGALGSANEWFAQPSSLSVWDPDWHGINGGATGAWVQADNVNPPIFQDRMTHNVHHTSSASMPLVRWMNPIGDGTQVNLNGELNVIWSGDSYTGVPVSVDVVIAMNDFSTGQTTPLLATTVDKPLAFASILDSTTIDVDLTGVALDEGDSLLFSLRGQEDFEGVGRWVILQDNVQISLVPAPGAFALLGLAGVASLRRRR